MSTVFKVCLHPRAIHNRCQKMEANNKTETVATGRDFRIDSRIVKTKKALKPSNLYATFEDKKRKKGSSLHEYGQYIYRGPMIAWALFLVIKLMVLYLIKGLGLVRKKRPD